MASYKYFIPTPSTLEELKSMYRKMAHKYHPDAGGEEAHFKAMDAEYDSLFDVVKNLHRNKEGDIYTKDTGEESNYFKDIINKIINCEGMLIEVIGSFVWCSENTKPYKDILKNLGFRWHSKKLAWYLSPPNYKKRSRTNTSMDDIRSMYGCVEYETHQAEKIA